MKQDTQAQEKDIFHPRKFHKVWLYAGGLDVPLPWFHLVLELDYANVS